MNFHPITELSDRVVAIAADDLILHRIGSALASCELGPPARVRDVDEAVRVLQAKRGDSVAALWCDVSEPPCMAELRRFRKLVRNTRVIVISPATDAGGVRRALDAGADAVVFESDIQETLGASVIAVKAGQTAVPRRLRKGLQKPAFSRREREVLGFVAAGYSNGQIASALFLSESTVKSHLSSAFAKLGVRSRKEAAALVLDPDQGIRADLVAAGVVLGAGPRTPVTH